MSFDFAALNPATPEPVAYNMITDAIRDQLPPNHTEDEFRYAFVAFAKEKIESYNKPHWLLRFWFGQSNVLKQIAEADPLLFADLVNHLAAKLEEITDPLPGGSRH